MVRLVRETLRVDGPSRDDLVAQLREIAGRLNTTRISRARWLQEGGPGQHHVFKYFDSWTAFVEAAGLEPDRRNLRLSDDELFGAMRYAFTTTGGVVTRTRFGRACRYGIDVYTSRWGRWENVLARFRQWAEEHDPDLAYLSLLPSAPVAAQPLNVPNVARAAGATPPAWTSSNRTKYGPFLNFRGLQHAPINEQGVVFLFGMVAFDLGYVVEGVGTGFPDCEAKRCVSKTGDVWERVRIEFEFKSRNFLTHGHDPAGCEVLVCWEHNWPACPVEVLELRSAIDELAE
jgi:hypothetical protein